MKAVRFLLIAVTVLLLLVALVAPGLIGPQVEKNLQQQLAAQPNVEVTHYQRGWFGAEARALVRGNQGVTEVISEIQHGPVLFTRWGPRIGVLYSTSHLGMKQLEPALRQQLENFYGPTGKDDASSPLLLEILVGANDRVRNTLRLLPIDRSEGEQQVRFEGGEIQLVTDYRGQQQSSNLSIGEFTLMDGQREALYFQAVNGNFQLNADGSGSLDVTLPLMRANRESGPLELHNAQLEYRGKLVAARTLNIQSKILLPEIQSATPVSALTQQINLPAISHQDLHHLLYNLLLTPAAQRSWPKVFQRPLQLQQQLDIETANGPVQMISDIDWGGMPRRSQADGDKLFWLDNLSGTLNLTATEQALTQSPLIMQAHTLKQYGLLLDNNGELTMHLQLDRGNLRVNDQPLPADLFILALTSGI